MRIRFLFFILLLTLLLAACSGQSGQGNISKDLQTVQSWTSTAYMVGDVWQRGQVPTEYAVQTLEAANSNLKQEQSLISGPGQGDQARELVQKLPAVIEIVNRMTEAVRRGDHGDLGQALQQLAAQEQSLDQLAKSIGAQ